MILSEEQKSILHDIENKFSNIVPNAEYLRKKILKALQDGDVTEEQLKEIEDLKNLLDDYFLDTADLLVNVLNLSPGE